MLHRYRRRRARQAMPRQTDIERRIDALERRLTELDNSGTRGVIALTAQVANQSADIVAVNGRLDQIQEKLDSAARVRLSQYLGFAMALMPVYVLLFLTVFHVRPA